MKMISATLGARAVQLDISKKSAECRTKTKTLISIKHLCVVYFQRLNKRLKTCDAVLIDADTNDAHVFTIQKDDMDIIRDRVECVVYMGGPDPLPWKRFVSYAKKHEWTHEDWQYFFEASSSESDVEEEGVDSDWKPDSESEDEVTSEDESEEDEESPSKRARHS